MVPIRPGNVINKVEDGRLSTHLLQNTTSPHTPYQLSPEKKKERNQFRPHAVQLRARNP